MSRDLPTRLRDMYSAAQKVQRYVGGRPREDFLADEMAYDAVLRSLELLGEAAKHVPEVFRVQHPSVQWRKIAGLRDVLSHEYFGVDEDIVWDIVATKVPVLLRELGNLLEGSSD